MTWTGTLRRTDLGAGAWVLETDRGERLQLIGEVPADLVGRAVTVKGHKADAMGVAMVGPIVQVERVTAR